MNAVVAEKKRFTVHEYLETERDALEKHEYFDGEIRDMAGSSPEHALITANVSAALGMTLRGRCLVFSSGMRLHVPATGLYTYADASVVCGKPEYRDEKRPPPSLINPTLLVEVLSRTTEGYDRGGKFENYRRIPSFTDYLLITQDRVQVDHFTRQPNGSWNLRTYSRGQQVPLPCEGQLTVDELYLGVGL